MSCIRRAAQPLFHLHAGGANILNLRHIPGDTSPEALLTRGIVRVDRATEWGNPFRISTRFGNRGDVIARYRRDLWRRLRSGEMPLDKLAASADRPLTCGCSQLPCHAEVPARAAAWAAAEIRRETQEVAPDS